MQLDAEMEKRIRARAAKEGVDPDEAIAEAKRVMAGEGGEYAMERPPVERLAPFFPFIRVSELRTEWFGLEQSMPDDDLRCSEFLEKYPPPAAPGAAPKPDDGGGGANVNEAKKWLDAAIARHERHMDGTEATDEKSQQKMMDEMKRARAALDGGGGAAMKPDKMSGSEDM